MHSIDKAKNTQQYIELLSRLYEFIFDHSNLLYFIHLSKYINQDFFPIFLSFFNHQRNLLHQ